MSVIQKILVPVDFSDPSRAALDYAAELARPFGASLDVLHVWEAPSFAPPAVVIESGAANTSLVELVKTNAEQSLDRFVAEALERGIRIRSARCEFGLPSHSIVEAATAGAYDLIVIGTHGRTGLARALMGSVAERVVRHAACPVLSVRPSGAFVPRAEASALLDPQPRKSGT